MRLQSTDGAAVELSIKSYQFGSSNEPRDWDANWLVVAGAVALSDHVGSPGTARLVAPSSRRSRAAEHLGLR